MGERRYLSIGEVLGLLLEEFPDVTISKIRFLESQGLIEPERTPSGYRKFYDDDVDRLRVILREQRTNFLPLRVIRDRLETGEIPRDFDPTPTGTIRLPRSSGRSPLAPGALPPIPPTHPSTRAPAAAPPRAPVPRSSAPSEPVPPTAPAVLGPDSAGDSPVPPSAAATSSALGPSTSGTPVGPPALTVVQGGTTAPDPGRPGTPVRATLTAEELLGEPGVDAEFVDALEDHGIITSGRLGGVRSFDPETVRAIRAAAALRTHGLEPRHLRVWKQMAERELSIIEQLVLPILRQRNALSRDEASRLSHAVEGAGHELQRALLERALRQLLS